ncbi:LysR family transcriptional regulator [Tepidibacter sp. Z1-5]|uniref:LysR family transcriptional regulator n=1 Tax=Tepidibacter sp. Z1-5 TaxID=3134138 RepID=UPI0030C4C8AA
MKLEHVHYILEIVRLGSINKAAKSLLMTQPNLSFSIKSLENVVGFKIFNRTNKGIELTRKGAQFLEHAKSIKSSFDAITNLSDNNKNISDTILNLSLSSQYNSQAFYALMDLYKKNNNNNINFKIKQTSFSEIVNDVSSGYSDIGFISIDSSQKKTINNVLNLNGLEFVHLSNTKLYACMSENHPLSNKDCVTLDELTNFPLVILNFTVKEFLYSSLLSKIKFDEFKQKIQVNNYHSLMLTLNELNAISFKMIFSTMTSTSNFFSPLKGTFKQIDMDEDIYFEFGYIKPSKSSLSPIALDFLDILELYIND